MHNRAMVAALVSCGLLFILSVPRGNSAWAAAAPPQPAVGHGDPSLPHSPQMLQGLAKGGRGAGPGSGRGAANAQGIDIASYQHPNGAGIDWGQVAGGGYKFAYIKATEGNYYQNPYYGGDQAGAAGAGMFRGAYHFAIPNASDGATQADYVLDSIGYANDGMTLPPMLDMEWDPYSSDACYGLNASQMIGWIAAFGGEMQRRIGRPPVLYTAANWWNQCTGGTSAFSGYPLAIASWASGSPQTPGWSTWTFWQTTSGANVPGVSGPVDGDLFEGDVAALAAFARGAPVPVPKPAGPETSWGPNRLDVVVAGSDNAAHHRAWAPGWSPWEARGGGLTSQPISVSWGTNRLDVFARGLDGALWHSAWDGSSWSGWFSLGGQLQGDPEVVSWGSNRLDVFVRGADNHLWHRGWDGAQWAGWEDRGGSLASTPAAAAWSANRLDVVAQGWDGSLWHLDWNGASWDGWGGLGGQSPNAPSLVAWGPNRLDVLIRGVDNQLWHTQWDGSSWGSGWGSLGGAIASRPAAVAWGSNRLDIVAQGSDSSVWHVDWNGASWDGWGGLGGLLRSGPTVVSWDANRLDVFGRGLDNAVWHTSWDGSSWQGPWDSLGLPPST